MPPRLQPYVMQAATLSDSDYNPMSFRLQPYVIHLQVQLAHAAQQLLTRGGVEREANTRVLELHLRHCRVQLLVLRAATHLVRVRVRVRVRAGVKGWG